MEYKLTCKICGGVFHSVYQQKRYCSYECAKEADREQARLRKRKGYKPELQELKCGICGKTFMQTRPTQRYCSHDCYVKGNSRKQNDRNKVKGRSRGDSPFYIDKEAKKRRAANAKAIERVTARSHAEHKTYGQLMYEEAAARQAAEMAERMRQREANDTGKNS